MIQPALFVFFGSNSDPGNVRMRNTMSASVRNKVTTIMKSPLLRLVQGDSVWYQIFGHCTRYLGLQLALYCCFSLQLLRQKTIGEPIRSKLSERSATDYMTIRTPFRKQNIFSSALPATFEMNQHVKRT